jgi:hypothetical protein
MIVAATVVAAILAIKNRPAMISRRLLIRLTKLSNAELTLNSLLLTVI